MKLITKALAIFLLLSINYELVAQPGKDAKATQILRSVSDKYKSLESLKVSFHILINDQKNETTNSQSGSLVIHGDKYLLSLKEQKVICDGQTVWTYLNEVNEVQINPVIEGEEGINPKNIFTIYENGFSSKYNGEIDAGSIKIQKIELVPDDENKSFFKVQLNINKEKKRISGAKIFEKNGTIITYTIQSFDENIQVKESDFVFNEPDHPGVEIIDLR